MTEENIMQETVDESEQKVMEMGSAFAIPP